MSLKSFHVVFISASVLLAFLLAAWCLTAGPNRPADAGRIVGAGLAALAGVGLVAYEAWFLRKMRRLP
ncbi:MAG TPA: hypothetical protein VEQ10_02505 [Vicinamibacteria bacterium]|nr:hypothetical protein [Vicinamibacteria bacterium]